MNRYVRDPKDFTQPLPASNRLRAFLLPRPYIKGLDINFNQVGEIINPQAIRDAGYEFIILEACWGMSVSPIFKEWPRLLDAGFIMLAYQFFDGRKSGVAQAALFLDTTRPLWEAQGFMMPLGGDVETFSGNTTTLAQRLSSWRAWIDAIRGVMPALPYSNIPSWREQLNNEPLPPADCYGWAAHWTGSTEFLRPAGWSYEQTLFHQIGVSGKFSWTPPIPGMAGDVGVDRFYGTREQLRALGKGVAPPPPAPAEPTHTDLMAALSNVVSLLDDAHGKLDAIKTLVSVDTPTEPPDPPVPTPIFIKVKVSTEDGNDKAVAFTYKQTNDKGFPIWVVAGVAGEDRLVFRDLTEEIIVYPLKVKGDGGNMAFRLAPKYNLPDGSTGAHGLYLLDGDVLKVA